LAPYHARLVDPLIEGLLRELPALLIIGPRAAGKTTTAARYARSVVRLDREADAAIFHADPDAGLRTFDEPILLDEWQAVPGVLGAVKRAVDVRPTPGRFLLTGSVRAQLEADWWPGTGRVTRVPLYGMTLREQRGASHGGAWLDRVSAGDVPQPAHDSPDVSGYVDLALHTGFPEPALRLSPAARSPWLESYLDSVLSRDVEQVETGRDPVRLRRYLEAYALNTAGVVDERTLFDAAGINRKTAAAYERLLANLMLVDTLPAWTSSRLKRLVLAPKRHLVEPGLLGAILRLDTRGVLRHGDLLGRILESFVLAQIRAEAPVTEARPRFYHLRQQQGRLEVDILAELGGGRLVGIEVKATAAPSLDDAKHLLALRDRLADDFVAGVILHTGPRGFTLADRIVAAPISTLWG
jgi:hypothetical protein